MISIPTVITIIKDFEARAFHVHSYLSGDFLLRKFRDEPAPAPSTESVAASG